VGTDITGDARGIGWIRWDKPELSDAARDSAAGFPRDEGPFVHISRKLGYDFGLLR
jgi:hypothetical protein